VKVNKEEEEEEEVQWRERRKIIIILGMTLPSLSFELIRLSESQPSFRKCPHFHG
jgi:hypothetical protein